MLSVYTKFLAHPVDSEEASLIEHLLKVGKKSSELFSQTHFKNANIAFYSGLLHDIGKLNSFYQKIFHDTKNRENTQKEASEQYAQLHSGFSAWAADKLLEQCNVDDKDIDKIILLIYGHHTKIRNTLGEIPNNKKFTASQKSISSALSEFSSQVAKSNFPKLNWDLCIKKFLRPIKFDIKLKPQNLPDDYLEMSYAFSCLLQADRGSFHEWSTPNFDLQLNTDSQCSKNSKLAKIRTIFQTDVLKNFDDSAPISIINAPTGIGKTKVFLDIMKRFSNAATVERVFYFSPLLALTEDFEIKIAKVISAKDDILIYNHLFAGSLQDKNSELYTGKYNPWMFKNESFNKKFVITTTQRLLMTLYSNKYQDKMKMASFKNSVMIVDEIQTIPKPILSNLKMIFEKMNYYMGTRFILVSATIPNELCDVRRVKPSKDTLTNYLLETKKKISIQEFNVDKIPIDKTLVMANTRKKAITKYLEITQAHTNAKIIYLSTGIKKQDRINVIKELSKKSNYVLVATQVVEAGVDISFSHVFREEAPLDNIIQVMGRLNREGENPNAELIIYPTNNSPIPYSSLEFQVTQEKIKNITNSIEIYEILEEYYRDISALNKRNVNETKLLERFISNMDFDRAWEFVRKKVFQEYNRDTVFIPNYIDWENVKNGLLFNTTKKNFKQFGNLTASLPISLDKVGLEKFDEELMQKNILLPKKQYLKTIYDETVGLDKWLI